MKIKLGLVLFALNGLLLSSVTRADEVYTFVVKKQEQKAKTGWNLSDWLETRDKMRLMDLWLAIHSPTPYEFFLSVENQIGTLNPGGTYSGVNFGAAAFATIFGLEGKWESDRGTRAYGMFDLRFFGYHDQATNMTLQLGIRQENNLNETYKNTLAGLRMTIYIAKFFGIQGLYRHYFDSVPTLSGYNYKGVRYEGGAFIDFKFLRVFGNYFSENVDKTGFGTATEINRTGVDIGAKLYF